MTPIHAIKTTSTRPQLHAADAYTMSTARRIMKSSSSLQPRKYTIVENNSLALGSAAGTLGVGKELRRHLHRHADLERESLERDGTQDAERLAQSFIQDIIALSDASSMADVFRIRDRTVSKSLNFTLRRYRLYEDGLLHKPDSAGEELILCGLGSCIAAFDLISDNFYKGQEITNGRSSSSKPVCLSKHNVDLALKWREQGALGGYRRELSICLIWGRLAIQTSYYDISSFGSTYRSGASSTYPSHPWRMPLRSRR